MLTTETLGDFINTSKTSTAADGRDLTLARIIRAPRAQVYQAWVDPELLKQCFVPLRCTVAARDEYERIGFHADWAICTEQLAALVEKV